MLAGMTDKERREKKIEKLVAFATKLAGAPYKYGATMNEAPHYFDCSGFVKYVFAHVGATLPRSTLLQAAYAGRRVRGMRNLLPGDLIFYRSIRGHYNPKHPGGIGHVVLYLGGDKAIHAWSKVIKDYPVRIEKGSVRVQTLRQVVRLEKKLVVIRRMI